jgi:predicted DNA-binding protein (MmcQ/YjbR family)
MTGAIPQTHQSLVDFALTLPGAYLDHPWGEDVMKVNKKVFVFFGLPERLDTRLLLGVKLPRTGEYALDMPGCKPMGYGLGKSGWVQAEFGPDEIPPADLLFEWIEESYRSVAPKRLIAQLEEARGSSIPDIV